MEIYPVKLNSGNKGITHKALWQSYQDCIIPKLWEKALGLTDHGSDSDQLAGLSEESGMKKLTGSKSNIPSPSSHQKEGEFLMAISLIPGSVSLSLNWFVYKR